MKNLLFEEKNGVAYITLNRPDKYNAGIRSMWLDMQVTLDLCAKDDRIRCIVITGAGKAFCAGQDLEEAINPDNGIDISRIIAEHYNPIVMKIRTIAKPIICSVNGVAAGAGANLAIACDITLAAESASFIQAFSKIGLIPDTGGTFYLPRLIGMQRATALMMTGEKVMAKDAADMGMIYKAIPDDQLKTETQELAETLAEMPTKALGLIKKALNQSLTNKLSIQLGLEDALQTQAASTEDYQEGVAAFLEKRSPKFKGK